MRIVIHLIYVAVGLLAGSGNVLIIAAVVKNRKDLLKDNSFMIFILAIAAADAVVGFGCGLSGTARMAVLDFNVNATRVACNLASVPMMAGIQASQLMTLAICFDRYKAVNHTLEYRTSDKSKAAKRWIYSGAAVVTISIIWMLVTMETEGTGIESNCTAGYSWSTMYELFWNIFGLTIGSSIIVMYSITLSTLVYGLTKNSTGTQAHSQLKAQTKATKTVVLVGVLYTILWVLPSTALSMSTILKAEKSVVAIFGSLVGVGSVLNSSTNIFVYLLNQQELRLCILKLFRTPKQTKVHTVSTVTTCG